MNERINVSSLWIVFERPKPRNFRERLTGRRQKIVYYVVLDRSVSDLKPGDSGIVRCECGEVPLAPCIMGDAGDGSYELLDGTLSIISEEFTMRIDTSRLKAGLNMGMLEHDEFGPVEVKFDFEYEDDEDEPA